MIKLQLQSTLLTTDNNPENTLINTLIQRYYPYYHKVRTYLYCWIFLSLVSMVAFSSLAVATII